MYSYSREKEINEIKLDRLVKWFKGEKAGPIQLDAELHRRCNLDCIACPRQADDFDVNKDSIEKELGKDKWLDLVRQAADLGIKKFNLEGGGEPTATPELIYPVMEEIKKQGMYGIVTTNGTLLTEERIKWLVELDWDRIHFSIDSYRADTHDWLRQRKGAFKKTIQSIRHLNKWKKKLGKEHPMLNINIVVNNKNYDKLPEMVELAHELEADYLFTEPLIVFSELGAKLKVDTNKNGKVLQESKLEAKKLAERYEIDNNFATKDKNLEEDMVESTSKMKPLLKKIPEEDFGSLLASPCLKPWRLMTIKYDGKAGHCGLIQTGESVKEKSLEDIWYGKYLTQVREKMSHGQLLEHCDDCIPSDLTQRKRFRKNLKERLKEENII